MAFVQDALLFQGGAEKVLMTALEAFPQADVFTLVYRPEVWTDGPFAGRRIHTSFLDRLPGAHRHHRWLLPLMPWAIGSIDLSGYDIVISFSYAVAHGVEVSPGKRHVAYFHTPMRYAWRMDHPLLQKLNLRFPLGAWALRRVLTAFQRWDRAVAQRPTVLAAVSQSIAEVVFRAYGRPARVLYPPVEIECFHPYPARELYYACLSRLVHHKRIDLAVQVFTRLGLPLIVIGEGPEERRLRAMAGPNVRFLSWQSQARVAELLSRARAFVHPGEEDFGIAMVEALASGCPVITTRRGSAPEIIQNGVDGLLYAEPDEEGLSAAVELVESGRPHFDPLLIAARAARFNRQRFLKEFRDLALDIQDGEPLEVTTEVIGHSATFFVDFHKQRVYNSPLEDSQRNGW